MGLKSVVVTGVLGATAFGALIWNGGAAIDTAKTVITDQAGKINIFKQNETRLVNQLNTVNAQLAAAQVDLDELQTKYDNLVAQGTASDATIADLQAQLEAKNQEIASLTAERDQLVAEAAESEADGETLANEITRLQGELNEANADAAELQTTLDNTDTTVSPDQEAVEAAIAGTPTTGGVEDPEPTPDPVTYDKEIKLVSGTPEALNSNMTLDKQLVSTTGEYEVTLINYGYSNYTVNIDGTDYVVNGQSSVVVGFADELDGSIMTFNGKTYLLTNQ